MGFFDAIGGIVGGLLGKSAADNQSGIQLSSLKSGIQWRVADAQKAGIHPLYALGAQIPTYQPVTQPDYAAMGSTLGQNIDNEISKHYSASGKAAAVMTSLQVERGQLENELLRQQIRNLKAPGMPPTLPSPSDVSVIPGQGDAREAVRLTPNEIVAAAGGDPSRAAGAIADSQLVRSPSGGYAIVPSKDVKNSVEDMMVPEGLWSLRNIHILSSPRNKPPLEWLPPYANTWKWNPLVQEWRPGRKGTISGSYFVDEQGRPAHF